MTDEQMRDLVKECGIDWQRGYMPLFDGDPTNRYAVLIKAVRAAERERCATLCESVALRNWSRWDQEARPEDQGAAISADELADAIRGEQR